MELVLGTAQFGLDYGVTNHSGVPSKTSIKKILDFAFANDVTKLDTAFSYGISEENLGSVGVKRFNISSKVPYLENYRYGDLEQYVSASLKRLGVSSLDILYLHDERNIHNPEIISELTTLKASGKILRSGASIYSIAEPNPVLKQFDIVQCQGNAFDSSYLTLLTHNYSVYLRSIFLQGLLLIEIEGLPAFLSHEKKIFSSWHDYCKKYGRSKLEMSLHNVNHNNLKAYIIGSSSLKEFKQIIAARNTLGTIQNVPLFEFDEVDKYLIDPRRWNL